MLTGKPPPGDGSGPMPELSCDHPSHLDQFGTHLAVCDQLFMYSTVNIFTIFN